MHLHNISAIEAHADRIWQAAVHPSLPLLATASGDKTTRITSLQNYTPLSTIDGGHKRSIRSVAWKPGTKGESVLATGSFDATAGIWRRYEDDLGVGRGGEYDDEEDEEWRFAVVLDGHESEIKSVAWSAGGSFLATCSRDKSVWIWEEMDEDNFETIAVLQEHTQDVKCVVWHPEEALLASASYDDTIRLYREDLDDWVCCSLLRGHESTVWTIVFEPLSCPKYDPSVSPRLASCSDDLTIRIWTRQSKSGSTSEAALAPSILRGAPVEEDWAQTATLPKVHDRSIYSIAWSPWTGRIVSCGGDGKIVVYEESDDIEMANGSDVIEPSTEADDSTEKAVSPPQPRPGRQWKVGALVEAAHGVFEINSVVWSKRYDKDKRTDDEEIIISCGDDGEVKIWELRR